MNQEQKDFADGIRAYTLRITGTRNAGRPPAYYRGWTWAWGNHDSRRGEINIFPGDRDYNDGYTNQLTDLHYEHPTPEGDRTTGSLIGGAA
jgi:hypothetical protein